MTSIVGLNVTICGGGNAAHVAAAMFACQGACVNVYFSFEKEARDFEAGMSGNPDKRGITVTGDTKMHGTPDKVSCYAGDVIPGADIVLLIVPAFAHEAILTEIGPHLSEGAAVGGIPAPGAFDLLAVKTLGVDVVQERKIHIFGGSSLPWACRTTKYGESVSLLGVKATSYISSLSKNSEKRTELLGQLDALFKGTKHTEIPFLGVTLWPTNCIIHPGVTYGIWHDWDEKPVQDAPLFYQNCNQFTGDTLDGLSDEIQATKSVLEQDLGIDLSRVLRIGDYMAECYGHEIVDTSSTSSCFSTNRAFRGLKAPMVSSSDGKLIPDFHNRYMTEDLPHGLCVLRGLAEICGVESPTMDTVIIFCQKHSGIELLKDGSLCGIGLASSGCPQRWGLTSIEDLREFYK